jgi:Bacterial regulatory protein, Fis family
MKRATLSDARIIEALESTCGQVYLAARQLGCQPRTIFRRIRQSPRVARAFEAAQGRFVETARAALYRGVLDGQAWAVRLALSESAARKPASSAGPRSRGTPREPPAGPPFLKRENPVTIQALLKELLEHEEFLEFCRMKSRPADSRAPDLSNDPRDSEGKEESAGE